MAIVGRRERHLPAKGWRVDTGNVPAAAMVKPNKVAMPKASSHNQRRKIPFRFAAVAVAVTMDNNVKASPHRMYCYLLIRKGKNQSTWISNKTIAKDLNLSTKQVARNLKALEDHGLVELREKDGKSHIYITDEMVMSVYGERVYWMPGDYWKHKSKEEDKNVYTEETQMSAPEVKNGPYQGHECLPTSIEIQKEKLQREQLQEGLVAEIYNRLRDSLIKNGHTDPGDKPTDYERTTIIESIAPNLEKALSIIDNYSTYLKRNKRLGEHPLTIGTFGHWGKSLYAQFDQEQKIAEDMRASKKKMDEWCNWGNGCS